MVCDRCGITSEELNQQKQIIEPWKFLLTYRKSGYGGSVFVDRSKDLCPECVKEMANAMDLIAGIMKNFIEAKKDKIKQETKNND